MRKPSTNGASAFLKALFAWTFAALKAAKMYVIVSRV